MPRIFLFTIFYFSVCESITAQSRDSQHIPDGLYLVIRTETDSLKKSSLAVTEKRIGFNTLFKEFNDSTLAFLVIDTSDYVPLSLQNEPLAVPQSDNRKKLLLSLTPEASEILKRFSSQHVLKTVAIVIDGEAVSKHLIKAALTSGQLQITRCNDNACEQIAVSLKDNVKTN